MTSKNHDIILAILDFSPILYIIYICITMQIILLWRFTMAGEKDNNLVRFLLTFFLGCIGSLIINHSSLKPEGWT